MTTPAVPIRRMLNSMALTTTGFALLVAVVLFLAGEFLALRRASLQEMRVLSEAIASNSTAALAFDVPDDARGVLNAFRSHPHIQAAALYDKEGQMFANFPTGVSPASLPATAPELGFRFDGWTLVGTSVVTEGQGPMGRLFVRSDMRPVYGRLAMHGLLASLVIGLALLVAWLITRRLQRKLSTPLLEMAETAKRVSERRDYTVRARAAGIDELDALTNAFNHMLTQNARVESRLTAQVNRLALLQQITHSIGSRHDLNSIFQVVLRSLEDHLPIHFGCICLRDSANESVVVESTGSATAQLAGLLGLSAGTAVPVGHNGLYRCINGALIHEPDTSEVGSPFTMRFADASLYSLVLAPLVVESNVFGVLVAARRERQSFSSADCEFLKQLSEHVALASHQAQLYGALQTTYEDLRHSQQTVMQNERLRALGEMASGIAHDINNAISPASLYAEMLLNTEANLSNASRGRLDTIRRAIEDVAGTIERMREFYRPREAARSFARLDIHGAIGQVLQLTEPRWRAVPQERGVVIELRKELAQSLPEVMGDEIELRDALTNLIFNAVDAMPDGGTLTVRTRPAAGGNGHSWVYVEVSDTGVGMDDETRRRCIEPFYTTKGQRGTGLGLASVYGMLQRHNATLEIDSAPGQGTTMRMIFPVLSQDTATTGSHAISAGTLRKHRILIIDDDPVLTRSLRDALESEGHAVESASGGQAGIDAFIAAQGSRREFALVITDLGMPRIDGRKVAAAIKQASPTVPVVMLTGWGQRLLDEHDIPPNVDRVLSKPPRLTQLRSTIFELVG